MINQKYNRFLQALLYLMLISAALHLCTLAVYFFITKDVTPLNFFSIVGLNLFYPEFVASETGRMLSSFASIGLYIIGYVFLAKAKR